MNVLNPAPYFSCVIALWRTLRQHKQLVLRLTCREISERYVGQVLGGIWAIMHPVLMLCIYFFLFSVVFKIRMPSGIPGMPADYFLYILSGLAPWLAFSEAAAKGPVSISSQSSLVKQVVFPLETLPVRGVLSSFLPLLVMGTLLVVYKICKGEPLFPGLLLLIPALLLQGIFATGLSLLTAAVGVWLRDLKDIVQSFMLIIIYLLPLFYLPEMVPNIFKPVLQWNPLSHFIWCWQDVFYYNGLVHPYSWLIHGIVSIIFLGIGARSFVFLKTYFGNVL